MNKIFKNHPFLNADNTSRLFFKSKAFSKSYADLYADFNNYQGATDDLNFHCPYQMFVAILASMNKGFSPTLHSNLSPLLENNFVSSNNKDIGLNVLSSGSTGRPKKIFLSLYNLGQSASNFNEFFNVKSDEVFLLNLPHHHVGGLMILWRAFFVGACVTTNFDEHFDFISLVPLQLQRLMADPSKLEKLKKARVILIGGAPFSDDLKEWAKSHNLATYETYGMSETASFIMLNGVPLKNVEIKLNEDSLFLIKTSSLSSSVVTDEEGFYHTKDKGEILPDGTYKFLRRSDLLFKSAGELINPLTVEEALRRHPFIKNVCCVSIPHFKWTHALTCIYELIDGVNETFAIETIKSDLRSSVNPYFVPKYFFKAQDHHFIEGQKSNRYELKLFAIETFFRELFSFDIKYSGNSFGDLFVVFHGFMENLQDHIALTQQEKTYNYLFIDLPGHGFSDINNFTSKEEVYFYLKELIIFFAQDDAITLYGYSMGGRVAIELILKGLEVKNLILESASFGLLDEADKKNRFLSDSTLLKEVTNLMHFFDSWYNNPIFSNYKKSQDYQDTIKSKSSHDKEQWQKSLEFFSPGASDYVLSQTINALKHTEIVGITGEDDTKYTLEYKALKSKLHKFEHFIIQGAGHNPHKTHMPKILEILNKI